MTVSLRLYLLPLKAYPWQAAQAHLTCPASISVWNLLAATPDDVNIEAPLLYLKDKISHKRIRIQNILILCVVGEGNNSREYLFPSTMFMASSMLSTWDKQSMS